MFHMEEQILKLITKIAGVGVTLTVAIVAAALLLLGQPAETAEAGQLASISLSCTPATQAAAVGNTVTCSFRFDEATTYTAAETVDGVSVTLTTVLGTWAANGTKSITFDCGNVGSTTPDSCNPSALGFALDVGTATGTNTVVISAGTAVDTFAIALTAAAGSGAADSIAHFTNDKDAIGYATTAYAPLIQASTWRVRVKDVNGLGLNAILVEFTTDQGVLDASGGACTGTLSTTLTATTALFSVYNGTAQIELCGKSTGAGETATVTAKVVNKPTLTATKAITISKKPVSADIAVTVDGTTISVEVFKDGVPAPDDTDIIFQAIPTTDAVVAGPNCVALHDGKASAELAVAAGKTVNVLVAAAENDVSCDGMPTRSYGSAQKLITAADATAPAATTTPAAVTPAVAPQPPAGGESQVVMTQADLTVFLAANTWIESVTFFDFGAQKYLFCHIKDAPAFAVDTCTLAVGSILGLKSS